MDFTNNDEKCQNTQNQGGKYFIVLSGDPEWF